MQIDQNQCVFSAEPLDRASAQRADAGWVKERLADPASMLVPLFEGDPLMANGEPVLLSVAALPEFGARASTVFLGISKKGTAYFAVDASGAGSALAAPFADMGEYMPLREAAGEIDADMISLLGQARWYLDWHHRHQFCARCGAETSSVDGGAKRHCFSCGAEHFPRTDPVAIVLAEHDGACLLGRGPHFPPGFLSALAGFVEAAETPEECAARELREEAGVEISDVRYKFSQPWPFPSSLMMGFVATARSRDLSLDKNEIVEARWLERDDVNRLRAGEVRDDVRLPPHFTIARQLIDLWAEQSD